MSYEIFNRKLATTLTKKGIIEESKIEPLIKQCDRENKSLSSLLTEKNGLNEDVLLLCISEMANLPPIRLDKLEPDKKLFELISPDWAKAFSVAPISKLGNVLTIAIANPFDMNMIDNIKILTGCSLRFVVATECSINRMINRLTGNEADKSLENLLLEPELSDIELSKEGLEEEEIDVSAISDESGQSPIIKIVNSIVLKSLNEGASDIHIEPFETFTRVRYRIDGLLREVITLPKSIHNLVTSRIKIMSHLDIAERRIPQDGKFQMKFEGRQIDFRVSILPSIHGEKTVIRVLDTQKITSIGLDKLGFEPEALNLFRKAINSPWGMILVTGPTGSGKSTTLYAAIKEIISVEDNIVTVEDPVEYQLPGITQVPVNPKRGLTFASALRSILRQDPDVILVGEIRDLETADIAIKAALTGHLVFSTLHTNDAASAITRLIDMGIDSFLISASLILVCAQRLARKLCDFCKEPYQISAEKLAELGIKPERSEYKIYKARGCSHCSNGYKGRFALLEALEVTEQIKQLIIEGKSSLDIKKYAIEKQSMLTLRQTGFRSVLKGITSLEEILRVTLED